MFTIIRFLKVFTIKKKTTTKSVKGRKGPGSVLIYNLTVINPV